ncbi:MAG TPA: hypothetical protein VGJ91_18670 [Polyangiaceae bacterium]
MNQPELARPARRHRSRHVEHAPENGTAARVTVAWTPRAHDGAARTAPSEIELVAALGAGLTRTWACTGSVGSNWLELISATDCREVVLTARLGNDVLAKHLVLDLAEFLTLQLTASQPLIRVLFATLL